MEGERERGRGGEGKRVSDTEERKWHKGRGIADIPRWTEGQRGQGRGEQPYLVQAGRRAENCHNTIKDTDRQSSMLLGRRLGIRGSEEGGGGSNMESLQWCYTFMYALHVFSRF